MTKAVRRVIEFEIPNRSTQMVQALLGLEELRRVFSEEVLERAMEAYVILHETRLAEMVSYPEPDRKTAL